MKPKTAAIQENKRKVKSADLNAFFRRDVGFSARKMNSQAEHFVFFPRTARGIVNFTPQAAHLILTTDMSAPSTRLTTRSGNKKPGCGRKAVIRANKYPQEFGLIPKGGRLLAPNQGADFPTTIAKKKNTKIHHLDE